MNRIMIERVIGVALLLFALGKIGTHCVRFWAWVPVPAVIESVLIDEVPGREHTNCKARVRYRFAFEGRRYQSEQLDFFGGDGIVLGESAEAATEAGKLREDPPKTCWVDPTDPSRSAHLPRRELDFSLVMLGIGILMCGLGFWTQIKVAFGNAEREGDAAGFAVAVLPWLSMALFLTVSMGALGLAQLIEERDGGGWVEAPAKVIESSLGYRDWEWVPFIRYEWKAEGERHRSERISFALFHGAVTKLEELVL